MARAGNAAITSYLREKLQAIESLSRVRTKRTIMKVSCSQKTAYGNEQRKRQSVILEDWSAS